MCVLIIAPKEENNILMLQYINFTDLCQVNADNVYL